MRPPRLPGRLGAALLALAALAAMLGAPGSVANFSNGGFACGSTAASTWTAGGDPTGAWFASGYDTTGAFAALTASTPSGVDCRALVQALPMPAAGTYTLSLRTRLDHVHQTVYWHVLGVTQNTTLTLTDGGVPQTITQPGVKSFLRVTPTPNNYNGAWATLSNAFTISATDAAAYRYVVIAIVASKHTNQYAQFDDVAITVPADTTDPTAGLTAQWFSTPKPVSALSQITWSNPIRTTKEEQINWPNNNTSPFVTGVPQDSFAVRITGLITVPTTGSWVFSLGADDGSSMTLDGATVFAADGLHSFTTRTASRTLTAGTYPIEVRFFENTGSQGLVLSWQGPGMTAGEVIPASAFRSQLRVVRWRPVSADE